MIVIILIVMLAGCGSGNEVAPTVVETIKVTEAPTETPTEAPTEVPTEEPVQSTPIEWTEMVHNVKDGDGYRYEITIKLSPWILTSNKQILNNAWNQVGKNETLPGFDGWGLEKREVIIKEQV